jgi:peptidoglycan-associated lipoprotein
VAKSSEECTLEPIHFAYKSARIRADQRATLKANATCIRAHPDKAVRLEGHSDLKGRRRYNRKLAKRRWQAVKNALRKLKVPPRRMKGKSFGMEKPVCEEKSDDCGRKNRRVELIFE